MAAYEGTWSRSWATKPKNAALIAKVRNARFFHYTPDLTYQSCRFCQTACYASKDLHHGENC